MSAGGKRADSVSSTERNARPALRASVFPLRLVARVLDVLIVLSALAALALWTAGARAPHLVAAVPPTAISPDGGHAFVFMPHFAPRWPYTVPSHPGSVLAPDDAVVLEDGLSIGTVDPSHADIRERGDGLHNMWDGSLWFSPSDDTDPRTNGRDYRLKVQVRLLPSAAVLRSGATAAAALLLLARLALAVGLGPVRWGERALKCLLRAASSRLGSSLAPVALHARRLAGRVPLTFRRFYVLVGGTALLGFVWQTWSRPALFVTQSDSFGYIFPGLLWASGAEVAGQSTRDIGYPALTVLAVRFGSLATLPRIQLVLVALGMACLLGSLYLVASSTARRLERIAGVPRAVSAIPAAAAAAGLVVLLASHDLFVIDIESAMAEAPHVFPTALALLLFLAAWVARSARGRVILMAFSALSAYASALFKPHTLIVVALCLASLAWMSLRHLRVLRSPGVVACCAAVLLAAVGLNRMDARVTPAGADFGTRTLFCNRLDVILPVFDTSTPARRQVAGMMDYAMRDVDGWPLMGYSGDRCVYNPGMQAAIAAAAEEDHATPARWMQREFLEAVFKNPSRYVYDAWKQAVHFFRAPVVDVDIVVTSDLSPDDATRYAGYAALINMPRSAWNVSAGNWVPSAYPRVAAAAKLWLAQVAQSFGPVTVSATAIALLVLLSRWRHQDCRPEIVVVATAAFNVAFIGTVLMSHSFDIGRYATDVLPISLLWWFVSTVYLVHLAVLAAVVPLRRGLA